jgi:signal transduction histidine kinase
VLIEDLLRLSRLDQGRVEMNIIPVDLKALVTQYVNDFALLAESKQLTLAIENSGGQPTTRADQGLLGQVLSVLLTNALNYTPAGGRVVVQVLTSEQEGRAWAGFSVSDTGAGIPQEEQGQLFQRFFRGDVGRASGAPGTGLGLAIAREIVERHGGRIDVVSKGIAGEGAAFTTWLPAEDKTTEKA